MGKNKLYANLKTPPGPTKRDASTKIGVSDCFRVKGGDRTIWTVVYVNDFGDGITARAAGNKMKTFFINQIELV